jgi:hypothetical protein
MSQRNGWIAATIAAGLLCLPAAGQDLGRADPYHVGSDKQLLIDDLFFESQEGVTLRIHPPRKTGERMLEPNRPWESATLNWFTVMEDDGVFRMWYECYDVAGWYGADDIAFCYAESADGVRWTRPNLGLLEYQGSSDNNILFRMIGPEGAHSRVHGTGVFKDPHAPPEARYKGVSQGLFDGFDPRHRVAGMVSPDGIHWTRLAQPVCETFADSQYSCFWDERLGKYVLYGRVGGRGRAIGRAESADFAHFPALTLVLDADDSDPPDSDLYNPAAVKYPYAANAYFMFPSLYQHGPDTLDIHLAVSRDGVRWTRPARTPFIPLGPEGAFDSGSLYMGQGLIRKGDEIWQYFSGSRLKHQEAELENLVKPGNERVYSRVVSRLDGFVSADAGPEGGWFQTPPLRFTGRRLELNVQVREGGEVRVALLRASGRPIKGFGLQECNPIVGDHTGATVTWNGHTDVAPLAGQPVKMLVKFRDASLYAFQFAP